MDIINAEHYMGLTAYEALKNLPKEGEIWTYTKKGAECHALIIKNQGKVCNTLALLDAEKEGTIPVRSISVKYTDPAMIQYVFTDELQRFIKKLSDSDFSAIVRAIESGMGIQLLTEQKTVTAPDNSAELNTKILRLKEQLRVYKDLYAELLAKLIGSDEDG